MARYGAACTVLAVTLVAPSLGAQQKLDLTGRPAAALAEPFTTVRTARAMSATVVLVTDPMERAVVLADLARGTVAPVGRQGEGPGEFRFPGAIAAGSGNTSWLFDPPLARVSRVENGRIGTSVPAPRGAITMRGSDAQGRLYFEGNEFDPESGTFSRTVPIMRFTPATGAVETIGRVSTGGRVILERPSGPMSMQRTSSPYPAVDAWVPLPDGRVAIVRADTFRIDVIDAGGTLRRGAPIAVMPREVSKADRDAFREERKGARMTAGARGGGGGGGPSMPAFEWRDEDFPRHHPPFRHDAVLAAPDGTIWIGRSLPASAPTMVYDIADANGRIVGTATLRRHATVVGFAPGAVFVARKDPSDDLVYLERHAR